MRSLFQPLNSVRLAFGGFRARRGVSRAAEQRQAGAATGGETQPLASLDGTQRATGEEGDVRKEAGGVGDDIVASEAALVLLPPNLRQQMRAMRAGGGGGGGGGEEREGPKMRDAAIATRVPRSDSLEADSDGEDEARSQGNNHHWHGSLARSGDDEEGASTSRSVSRFSARSADMGIDVSIATVEGALPGLALSHPSTPSASGDANWRYV